MSNNNGEFKFPEEIRSRFTQTDDLVFKGGSRVSAAEIWRFMTEEAPKRWPYVYDTNPNHQFLTRLSRDVEFFSSIKRTYIYLTMRDRLLKAHANGTPIVFVQGYQTMEPYHAADAIPVGTGFLSFWATNMKEGLSINEFNLERRSFLEAGRNMKSVDACSPMITAYAAIHKSAIPIDYVAPYLGVHCSDIVYLAEGTRSGIRRIPTYLVDIPPTNDKSHEEWAVKYTSTMLKGLTKELGGLSKRTVSEEDLKKEIKLENKARKLIQDYAKLWWSASIPPTNSSDHMTTFYSVHRFLPETTSVISLLEGTYKEVKERVKHSIKGEGLVDEPVRVFSCGAPGVNHDVVDKAGGVMVGGEVQLAQGSIHVDETGDPYENLAKAIHSLPHERPIEERAAWILEQVRKSRADGVLFGYNWGCNNQSAAARMFADIVKKETGLPTMIMEPGERGTDSTEQTRNRVEAFIEMLK